MRRIDSMQRGFLRELGIDERTAFLQHNFAPPSLRRRIGLLGFLQKRVLGLCHPLIVQLLPYARFTSPYFHSRRLQDFYHEVRGNLVLFNRSLFAFVNIYNVLPQDIVDLPSVKAFQSKLTHLAKHRAQTNDDRWSLAYEDHVDVLRTCHGI